MLESLALLAQAMQNDLVQVQAIVDPPVTPPHLEDDALRSFFFELESRQP